MNGGLRGRRHGAALLTIGVLSTAGLSACTGNEAPPEPSSSSIPAPTTPAAPSPTATPPEMPKAEPTPESAEAFVRYFWEVYNYSYENLDPEILQGISSPGCLFCQDSIKAVDQLKRKQQVLKGGRVKLTTAVAPPIDPRSGIIITTIISESPAAITELDGSKANETKGVRNMKSEIALDWDKKWMVRDLANDENTGRPW